MRIASVNGNRFVAIHLLLLIVRKHQDHDRRTRELWPCKMHRADFGCKEHNVEPQCRVVEEVWNGGFGLFFCLERRDLAGSTSHQASISPPHLFDSLSLFLPLRSTTAWNADSSVSTTAGLRASSRRSPHPICVNHAPSDSVRVKRGFDREQTITLEPGSFFACTSWLQIFRCQALGGVLLRAWRKSLESLKSMSTMQLSRFGIG